MFKWEIIVIWKVNKEVLFTQSEIDNFRLTNKIADEFHNFSEYDVHFIKQEIAKFGRNRNVISPNIVKYMAFVIETNWHSLAVIIYEFNFRRFN